jgi:hypothetical protein
MDPISVTLAAAIAAGAAAALKETAGAVIKDAYSAIKAFISKKYNHVDTAQIEHEPGSKNRQAVLSEELAKAGAEQDNELRALAAQLVNKLEEHAPDIAGPIGVDLKQLKARLIEIGEVSDGTGVRANTAEVDTIKIGQVGKKKSKTVSRS